MKERSVDTSEIRSRGKARPTVNDVAAHAGVAIGTVSRYLNGHELRRGNRERIEQAIAHLDYRRNALAAAMKTNVTNLVGLLVSHFDEFHASMLDQLVTLLKRSGRVVLIYNQRDDPEGLREAISFFRGHAVDALVISGDATSYVHADRLFQFDVPVVLYNNDIQGLNVDRVFVDNRSSAMRATNHLIDLGHERIAIVTGNLSDSSGEERYAGFAAAMADQGLAIEPDYVDGGGWDQLAGYAAAQRLMELNRPPSAILFSNYVLAYGGLDFFRERRIRVPEDVSVVSFDDVKLFQLFGEGITAVAQPIEKIAKSVASLVISRLSGQEIPHTRTVTLECNIVLRGSTRKMERSGRGRKQNPGIV